MLNTKLATVSAFALALALAAPASAQEQTDPVLPGAGDAQIGTGADGLATDPLADPADGFAADPLADTADGMAADPMTDPADGMAADPLADPVEGFATDPLADPADGLATDPLADPADGMAADGVTGGAGTAGMETAYGERMDAEALRERLIEFGAEDVDAFQGAIVSARAEEGFPFVVMVGPQDFAFAEGDAPDIDAAALRDRMSEAGLQDVRDESWEIVRGTFEGHSVFVGAADAALARATVDGEAEIEGFHERLSDAGVENVEEIDAKLFRASADDGRSLFVLVGPEGFVADGEIALSDDELRERFAEAGLSDIETIDDGIEIARGEHPDGYAILAVAGSGFMPGQTAAN